MATTTITVQEIRPPQGNGKKYILVADNGDWYYIWPEQAGNYQEGGTYTLQYDVSQFNGRDYRNVAQDGARGGGGGYRGGSRGGYSRGAPAPRRQAPPPQQAPAPQAQANSYYRPTSPEDKLSMFVTAVVKAGVQSGQVQFNDEAISIAIQQAVAGYRDGWMTAGNAQRQQAAPPPSPAPAPRQTAHPDLDDEIPF